MSPNYERLFHELMELIDGGNAVYMEDVKRELPHCVKAFDPDLLEEDEDEDDRSDEDWFFSPND